MVRRQIRSIWTGDQIIILAREGEKVTHETLDMDPESSFGFHPPVEEIVASKHFYIMIERRKSKYD